MSGGLYWRNLHREHQRSLSQDAGPGRTDQNVNLLLGALGAAIVIGLVAAGDYRSGFDSLHRLGLLFPVAALEILSTLGNTVVAISLMALFARRHPRALWMGVLAVAYAAALTHALKGLFELARPAAELGGGVTLFGPVLRLHSFPSGHTVTAFLLAACLSVGARGVVRIPLYLVAAGVGLSRVWAGAHWPIDVIAGTAIAGLSVALAIPTMRVFRWGLGLMPHLLFVSLIAACGVFELLGNRADTSMRLLHVATAALSLAVLTRDYLVTPWLRFPRDGSSASIDPRRRPERQDAVRIE